MKPVVYLIAFLALLCGTPAAWAGPAEEIAEIQRQQAAAGQQNNADAFTAAFGDNAAVTPFWAPFRVDGRAAIKGHFATLFDTYPTRQGSPRQASTRVYANDSVAVTNNYGIATWTDKKGNVSTHYTRISQTWVKIGAESKIVDQHVSRVPIP